MNLLRIMIAALCLLIAFTAASAYAQDLVPVYDKATSLWGYAHEKPAKGEAVDWIIEPQFAWADEFSDGMASAIIGCRYADCKYEPGKRHLRRRAFVVITPDFERTNFSIPEDDTLFEDALFDDMSVYAIADDNYAHISSFSATIPGHACVKLKQKPCGSDCDNFYIDCNGRLKALDQGRLVPVN